MTTTHQTGVRPLSLVHNAGNLLPLFETSHTYENQPDGNRLLHLSHQLQTNLDIDKVLGQFSDEIKPFVPHDYLGYTHDNKSCAFSVGKNARHRLSYQLTINDERLGTLVLSRKRKFTHAETCEIENLICALLYPLRNALLYHEALRTAHKDALTGICNRAALNEALGREVEVAQRHNRKLGMIVFDIDHFKKINDTYGHATGDCLLKALARAAEDTVRTSDQLFRYGGEEFIVLLPETGIRGAKQLAERMRLNIEGLECICEGNHVKMTASFGVSVIQPDESEKSFFIRTDKALYKAKNAGRNCTMVAK